MDDIYDITCGRTHLVLLGAGASLAAFPEGDSNGLKLPLMRNFVETVPGLADCLDDANVPWRGENFEVLYSDLCDSSDYAETRQLIESTIYGYFASMALLEKPTLYDQLVLALRPKDVVATFNWDPFLWQACVRVARRFGPNVLPICTYLHGSTAVGICPSKHDRLAIGPRGSFCRHCGHLMERCPILYPVRQKDYSNDPFIQTSWKITKAACQDAYFFTIFGYGAPDSDVEAKELLQQAWGNPELRDQEQVEIIDIKARTPDGEDELTEKWSSFTCRDHYSLLTNIYDSHIMNFPRRSCDALFDAAIQCNPRNYTPLPTNASWEELDDWIEPYLAREADILLG